MSSAAIAARVERRWSRCGRNLRRIITMSAAVLSGTSAAIAILSFAVGHTAAYVLDEVSKELALIVCEIDALNDTVSALQASIASLRAAADRQDEPPWADDDSPPDENSRQGEVSDF
jgi:hypothetical protein